MMFLRFIFVIFLLLAFPSTVWAACTSPAGVEGEVVYNASESVPQYCDGTNWIGMGAPGSGGAGAGCSQPNGVAGVIIYNYDHHVPQFCNDGQWVAIGPMPGAGGSGCLNPSGPPGMMIYNTDAQYMQYCDGTDWIALRGYHSTVVNICDTPDPFDFTDDPAAPLNTVDYPSDITQVTGGFTCTVNVNIGGHASAEYRICNDGTCSGSPPFGASTQQITSGQYVQVRLDTPDSHNVARTANLTVGQDTADWIATTVVCDNTPDAFSFTDLTDQPLNQPDTRSDIVQITGIENHAECGATITLSGDASAEYRICDDGSCSAAPAWITSSQVIDNGQYVQARVTTSGSNGGDTNAALDIGGVADTFTATTVPEEKFVFVATNGGAGYSGNFGGVTGADSVCGTEGSGLGSGSYKAWIADSSGTNDPANNFTGVGGTFRYKLPGGTVIADNWADLTDGTLDAGINENASGGAVGASSVWSNVAATSGATLSTNTNQSTCEDWVSNASNRRGQEGTSGSATSTWTDNTNNNSCNSNYFLYCFEQ